ncbi:MAG TPA: DUF2344 domain-containing protein [Tissierellia bacterium]|nr:DUF2344 domain-containing protein [Tissierellia bacterium]
MNVRLRFEKLGVMQFLSHLEVLKTWEQIFRREQIPMIYSEGFNPRPKMNFALPLAVGIQALHDYLEVEVEDGFDIDRFLTMDMPPGLKVTEAKVVEDSKALMAFVSSADFLITGDLEALKEGLSRDELLFRKHTKKGERIKDAKPLIIDYKINPDYLWVHLKAGSVDNLKPTDLLSTLVAEPKDVFDYEIIRIDVYDETGRSLWLR